MTVRPYWVPVRIDQLEMAMKIVQLTAENIKRLQAVQITPDGALVTISGRNAQGKTSVLDAITYALGGKDVICDQPLRKGQGKGRVVCDLDDLVVTRTFTAGGGGSLVVTTKAGERMAGPQGILDRLVGKLTFDPLGFSRMESKQQAATLRELAGLDFTQIDAARQASYDGRTVANRTVSSLEATLVGMKLKHVDAPAAEVELKDLLDELQRATDAETAHRVEAGEIQVLGQAGVAMRTRLDAIAQQIKALFEEQAKLEEQMEAQTAKLEAAMNKHADFAIPDMAAIRQRMQGIEETNRKVRDNSHRERVGTDLAAARNESEAITARIEELDEAKRQMLAKASFPVDGLSFDETGVTLNGVPFTQASGAEQLRTSVAIGLAMNPTLRVLLIRDGSLLDSESLAMIAKMADERDAQIWLERVSDGDGPGVVIEDGCVAAVTS